MKRNAFTLIELLAVIIIIGVIAVIIIPKINDALESSKKGAAQTSALNYVKAVDTYYMNKKMNKEKISLDGTYVINDNGELYNATNTYKIEYTGGVLKNGKLTYNKDEFISGCLTINGYKIDINENKETTIEKGECQEISLSVPTIASCPGCKFIYTTDNYAIEGSDAAADYSTNMPTEQDGLTDNYTTLIGEGGHPYFLGLIESTTTSGTIGRAFACGVKDGTYFCIEGTTDGSKDSKNRDLLVEVYGEYDNDKNLGCSSNDYYMHCYGSLPAATFPNGSVNVGGVGFCHVGDSGTVNCIE